MSYNEAQTRFHLIDPKLFEIGWTRDLIMTEVNAGPILNLNGKFRRNEKYKRTDYLLAVKLTDKSKPHPVAVIEAKAQGRLPIVGLAQAQEYARRLNVPFVFSSNGHRFIEYNSHTGRIGNMRPMEEFPTPDALRRRYEEIIGFRLDQETALPLFTDYSRGSHAPRYYQDAAIRAALEKIARGEKRILLALATGAGKTFIAVHLLKRLSDAGQMRRALFVCDRTELRNQAAADFDNIFGRDAQPVTTGDPKKNAKVLIATYQTLDVDGGNEDDEDANFLLQHYPENYFSHIIIVECHRSAWGKWSKVLTHNSAAVQIGLTATPRQLAEKKSITVHVAPELAAEVQKTVAREAKITADNHLYFGPPAYEYTLTQGNEDGYLAVPDIVSSEIDLDQRHLTIKEVLDRKPIDAATGLPITDERYLQDIYKKTDFENKVTLPDRVYAMCHDFFQKLLANGDNPHQKSIIFSVRHTHAVAVTNTLNDIYAIWCRDNGMRRREYFAFTCTAEAREAAGSDYLAEFKSSKSSHYIAVTVDLISTGVDVPAARNIVFFRYLKSPIVFYQMVGRGTRIVAGKYSFRIHDYTDAVALFGEDFISQPPSLGQPSSQAGVGEPEDDWPDDEADETEDREPRLVEVAGFDVQISLKGYGIIVERDGRPTPIPWQEYRTQIAERLRQHAPDPDDFRRRWIEPAQRQRLITSLPQSGQSAYLVQQLEGLDAYDLYDVLLRLGYEQSGRTRYDRAAAFNRQQTAWLKSLGQTPAVVISAFVNQFAEDGTEALENREIWRLPEVAAVGGSRAFAQIPEAKTILHEMKERIFAA